MNRAFCFLFIFSCRRSSLFIIAVVVIFCFWVYVFIPSLQWQIKSPPISSSRKISLTKKWKKANRMNVPAHIYTYSRGYLNFCRLRPSFLNINEEFCSEVYAVHLFMHAIHTGVALQKCKLHSKRHELQQKKKKNLLISGECASTAYFCRRTFCILFQQAAESTTLKFVKVTKALLVVYYAHTNTPIAVVLYIHNR